MPVIHLRVAGKVQGVGFRWFVRETAQQLGVSGWVRNTRDGQVEVAASSGDQTRLDQLEAAVQRGPSSARVQKVEHITPEPGATYPSPFSIER